MIMPEILTLFFFPGICLPSPILPSSSSYIFLLQGLQLLSFPNPAVDPRTQISKLAALFYMLREGIVVNGEWLNSDELGLFFLMLFGEVRRGTVCNQNEQGS